MLNHREALFERMRQMLTQIAPVAAQMTFLPGQLDELGTDRLFLVASEKSDVFAQSWKEIAVAVAAEREDIIEEWFAGSENMTGEAEDVTT